MKKISQFIAIILLFVSARLMAQAIPNNTWSGNSIIITGGSLVMSNSGSLIIGGGTNTIIGSWPTIQPHRPLDEPISASEMCAFLNAKATVPSSSWWGVHNNNRYQSLSCIGSDERQPNIIISSTGDAVSDIIASFASYILGDSSEPHSSQMPICINYSYQNSKSAPKYFVLPGHHDDTIEFYSMPIDLQVELLSWRKNPTAQELCDVINNEIQGSDEKAFAIKQRYFNAAPTIIDTLNLIMGANLYDDVKYFSWSQFYDEKKRCFIKFSDEPDEVSFPGMTVHAVVVEGMEYDRPSVIAWDVCAQ